ncbi:cation:proton antiporter [filamentous cyanobacterium LEGE 11480]|uniref:Cation:proton antiporter n=1 Tax=Romeriopsis navalis LEGE 11480 TaxID=2777977 RepID=A0A928VKV4_9CYAN|nr:cation:proton antiporter [Romeriopsis navalis]MBE9030195.1 cation:proton antiporter [Romeriopsis navalis LEGE 11480]
MQEDFRLIVDLVLVLAAAAGGGLLAALLKQPVLLGYLLAGIVVGPTGLGLIKELVQVETLAQFGVAFLLFALGVEFSFSELNKVKVISLGGGGLQILLTIVSTTLLSLFVGWVDSPTQGVFLGAILSLSSTAVVLKSLMERNETETPHGQVMLGILVVQDLALGLMLAVLPALDQPIEEIGLAIGWALLQTGLFAFGAVVAGIWLIPPLLRLIAKTESRELFLLGVCAICLGIALLTEHLGLSIEMGAFVAGLMISEVEYADEALTYVEPIRDIFAALFFAAIGMLIDPVFLWQNWSLILSLVAIVFVGKVLLITPLVRLFGYPLRTALISGLGLAQIGEFSFVLSSEGRSLGLVSQRVYLLILGTTAVTLVVTPFVLRLVPQLLEWAESVPWLDRYLTQADVPVEVADDVPQDAHVVVCGYGRIGRNIVRVLRQQQVPVVVIDQSESRVQLLRDESIPYVYGNAGSLYVLEKAGVETAQCMAIALPDPMSSRLSLKRSLEISPDLDIVVRASKPTDVELLYQLGAKEVVQPQLEASLELSAHVLSGVGNELTQVQELVQQIRNSRYATLQNDRPIKEISREVKLATSDLNSRWYVMPKSSPLLGMTLEQMDVRQLTGATLVAIRRPGGGEIDYPTLDNTLEQGDRVLLVGSKAEIAAFDDLAKGEAAVPSGANSCQWVRVEAGSPLVKQPLARLAEQFPKLVGVQAIRREGNFLRSPDDKLPVAVGDRLLLCGPMSVLQALQDWLLPDA